jgi:hypothetical protein
MRPARGFLVPLVPPLASALLAVVTSVALLGGERGAQASTPSSESAPGSAAGTSAPGGSDEGGAKKKARKPSGKSNSKKSSPKTKSSPATKVTRSKSSTHAAQKLAHAPSGKSGTINESVTLTPFPSHAGAAKKALAQNRRDQLDDAEKAARAPEQAERRQTVLFHLRDLDARSDSEGCFWRLVSYYRLGQIERARSLRPACELTPKDTAIIESEDEQAAHRQAAATLADKEPAPGGNLAPYAGDGPAKTDR